MAAIAWVVRILLILLAARFVLRLLFGQAGSRPSPPRRVERTGGTLVRDPECGTYIAQGRAIAARSGGETLHFCSTACRDKYLGAHARTG